MPNPRGAAPAHAPGDGRADIVLVHGLWHGAWCWLDVFLPYLAAAGWTVHARDLPGHGARRGDGPLRFLSIRTFVEDLAAFTATLPNPPILIGHSMGALVVQKYLERYPAAAGVLLAPAPPDGVWRATLRLARRQPCRFARSLLGLRVYPLVETPALAREQFFSPSILDDTARLHRYHAQLQDDSFRAFLDMLLLDLPRPAAVTAPVLVIGAGKDVIFPPSEVEATARAYGTVAKIIAGMAHDMMLEPGWREVADEILTWLARQGLRPDQYAAANMRR